MHVSPFRHGSARVLIRCSNVRPHAVVYAFNCVHADNMRLSSWTSKLLACSAVWGYMLRLCLWWTTIYNNVKLTLTSRCAAGPCFNMTHPNSCFVQQSFLLLRAVCGLITMQLFCLHSVGCFLAHLKLSYFTPLENILVEKITAFILCVFQVHAVSQDLLTTYWHALQSKTK